MSVAKAFAAEGRARTGAAPLSAAAAEPSIKVYFGAGCFWHVQHEFVLEEQSIGRRKETLTSMTGYAGGQRTGDGGAVCYHNPRGFSDYGKYGHTEVVQLEIPESQMARFSKKYFDLFGTRGYRHDPQDRKCSARVLRRVLLDHILYVYTHRVWREGGVPLQSSRLNSCRALSRALCRWWRVSLRTGSARRCRLASLRRCA